MFKQMMAEHTQSTTMSATSPPSVSAGETLGPIIAFDFLIYND